MEISEGLAAAWKAVEDSGVPEELHLTAFEAALERILPVPSRSLTHAGSRPRVEGQLAPEPSGPVDPKMGDVAPLPPSGEFLAKLAHETGIDSDTLEPLVAFTESGPQVTVASRKLGKNKADQTRAIALLLVSAQHHALDVVETSLDVVRAEAIRLKCYDQGNFSKHVGAAPGVNVVGPAGAKTLKLRNDGITRLKDLVESIGAAA